MTNKTKVSFDDIKTLKSFFTEGKFSCLSKNIRALKDKMIVLNDNAKKIEKELKLQKEVEVKARQEGQETPAPTFMAKIEDVALKVEKVEEKPKNEVVLPVEVVTQKPTNLNLKPANNQSYGDQNSNYNQNYQNRNQYNGYQNNYQNRNGQRNDNRQNQYGNRNGQNQFGQNQYNRNGQNGFNRNNNNGQNSYQNNRNFAGTLPNYNGQRPPFNKDGKPGFNRPNTPYLNKVNNNKPSFMNKPKIEKIVLAPQQPQRDFSNKKKGGIVYEEKKTYSKRDLLKRGMIEEENLEDRMLSRKIRPKKKEQEETKQVVKPTGPAIITTDNLTVKILSEATGKSVSEIIKNFMLLGMSVTINSTIDFATAELIANEMGIELQQKLAKTSEDKLHDIEEDLKANYDKGAIPRAPIVTVMGHVDHGKTSLLDYIKKTKVTQGEAGGITQHIGAYKVNIGDKSITFIDTPGHEAFTMMRARGASVTDIAILVVAADDGLMPQTIEAINHIKAAGVPMIVAINKMDKEQANPDRVMQQLAEHNVLPEAWGGDAIIVTISALTGEGISKLLEMILLVAEMQELKANPNKPATGTVLEAQLDKGRGPIASLIVRDGSLHIGDTLVCGTNICKVKAMVDENKNNLKVASPSTPVSVLGFNGVPNAGDSFTVVDEKLSKQIIQERISKQRIEMTKTSSANTLEDLMAKTSENDVKVLNILIKTDVGGSLEAIKQSVMKLNNDEVHINILHSGVGAISESDVILANASNAMIIGFNVRIDSKVKTVAERNKVVIKNYRIIYELLDDLELTMKGMKEPKYEEVYLGKAEILQVFKLSTSGLVAGSRVKDGVIARNEHARIIRDGKVVCDTMISSVKIVKDDVKEAGKDRECGIKLNTDDFKSGDIIECYTLKRIED